MSEPKFLRSAATQPKKDDPTRRGGRKPQHLLVTEPTVKQKRVASERNKKLRVEPKVVKPPESPAQALVTLSDAWSSAQAAQFAGTPPDSPVARMILEQIERVEGSDEPRAIGEPAVTGNIQDDLVARHRVDIAETRRLVMRLINELDQMITMDALFLLIADVCNPTDDKGQLVNKVSALRKAFYEMTSLPSRTDLALKLANSLRALVPLERQAAGLPDGYVDAATERAKKEQAATVTMVSATSYDAIRGKFDQILKITKTAAVPA